MNEAYTDASYPPMVAQEDEIDFFKIWRTLRANKGLILFVTVLVTAAAIAFSLVMTPVYRAQVLMAPAKDDSSSKFGSLASRFGGLASMAGVSLPGSRDSITAVATLKSRKFLDEFIAEHDLKPILFKEGWDAEKGQWKVGDGEAGFIDSLKKLIAPPQKPATAAQSELQPGEPTAWRAHRIFSRLMEVSTDKTSGLVTLTVDWEDPQVAADWANQLVERLNRVVREKAVQEAERSINYLQDQMRHATLDELRLALAQLIEEQIKSITLAKATDEYAFKVIDPATPPELRVRPKRTLMTVLGAFLGVILGVFVVFFRHVVGQYKERYEMEERSLARAEADAAAADKADGGQ